MIKYKGQKNEQDKVIKMRVKEREDKQRDEAEKIRED